MGFQSFLRDEANPGAARQSRRFVHLEPQSQGLKFMSGHPPGWRHAPVWRLAGRVNTPRWSWGLPQEVESRAKRIDEESLLTDREFAQDENAGRDLWPYSGAVSLSAH
jgi:hypothetical protein